MAIGDLEIRMAHLEGAYEQINERVATLDADIRGLRTDVAGIRADVAGVQAEVAGVRTDLVRVLTDGVTRTNDLRQELLSRMDRQFFGLLGLLIVSIFLPIARTFGR